MISYLRRKKKISMELLSKGLCSTSALQRLEYGERLPDFFVLERLLERLGLSVNKMEFLYDEAAYEIYYLREIIEKELEEKNYPEVAEALIEYQSRKEAAEPLHRQYRNKIQAVVEGEEKQNHQKAVELLEEAIKLTVPDLTLTEECIMEEIEQLILGEGELLLLLLWIEEKRKLGGSKLPIEGRQLLQYIDRTYEDQEVKANVYSKAAWVMGTLAILKKEWQEALWYTLQGEAVLAENGLLLHLPEYLERILSLTGSLDREAYGEWIKQRDALKKLYKEYGEPWENDQVALWKNYRQQEVYLVSEVFGQERRRKGHSQEKLADILDVDQKTISRIETGKYKPKPGTFQKIWEYLDIDRDICSTRIVTEDFALLEIEREIARQNTFGKEEEARKLYLKLKEQLSDQWKENRQYKKYMETLFANQLGEISEEDAIRECEIAFCITRGEMAYERLEEVVLSRTEAMIINYIAICYKKMGQRGKAIELREKMLSAFENSKVDPKFHYVALSIIYTNLSDDYEVSDRFQEAVKMCDKAIAFELGCKKSLGIGFLLEQKRYSLDRKNGERECSKEAYRQAYQILKLTRAESHMISLKNAYEKWYRERID